jgi:hypothetical protein
VAGDCVSRSFFTPDEHGYIPGAPYHVTAERWDPEEIDRTEQYRPYLRGSCADRGVKSRPLKSSERSDVAPCPPGASPARIPGPHMTLADNNNDPEGGMA